MRFQTTSFLQESDFYTFLNKLSEEGRKSLSCRIVGHYYSIASRHFSGINQSLRTYRDANGSAIGGHIPIIKSTNQRLETEMLSLIAYLLAQLPNLESIINDDSQTSEADKILIRESYSIFKSKIDGLYKLLGNPCFAVKAEEP